MAAVPPAPAAVVPLPLPLSPLTAAPLAFGVQSVSAAGAVVAAGGTWVQPYDCGAWAWVLPAFGGVGPALLVLAGCAAGVAVPLVLHRWHPKARSIQGLGPSAQLLAAFGATLLLLLLVVAVRLGAGSDAGFGGAAAELAKVQADAVSMNEMALGLNSSGVALLRELGRLSAECPAQVRSVLGGSIEEAKGTANSFLGNVSWYAAIVGPLPQQLETMGASTSSAGIAASSMLSLAVVATLLGAGAIAATAADVQFLEAKLQRFMGHYNSYEGPALGLVGGFAAFLVAASAAAALALGARAGGFCRDVDGESLRYVGESFGWNSSAYGLSRYYIEGLGANPLLSALAGAQSAVESSRGWVSNYQWVIQKSCPQWNSAAILADLDLASRRLVDSQTLLEPTGIYSLYCDASRVAVCDGALPTLGWLVLLQALLGLVCLPALTFTGSQFLQSFSEGHQFSRLRQEDHADSDEEHEDFNPLYYAIYALAVFTFVVGAFMYFLPSISIVRRLTGTLLYAAGIFLLMNSDLLVTFARLHYQMDRFKGNNKNFEKSLTEQAGKVRELTRAAKGLDTISKRFNGNVKQAIKEVERLSDVVRSDIKMCCKNLLRLYSDAGGDRVLVPGPELEETFSMMRTVFAGVFRKDYDVREKSVRDALQQRPGATRNEPISEMLFADLQSAVLSEPDPKKIPSVAKQIVDKSARGAQR